MPHAAGVTAFPKGVNQEGFRNGGQRRLPDHGPDPTDVGDYLAVFRTPNLPGGPEARLMAAVLEDAIHVLRKCGHLREPKTRALYDEARTWLAADDDAWPFSFVRICETLGLAPSGVRRRVLAEGPQPSPAHVIPRAAHASDRASRASSALR